MIPVTQDVFGEEGNCMAACVASILEMPLREVPNFAAGNNRTGAWFERIWEFLHQHGYEIIPYYLDRVNPETNEPYKTSLDFQNPPEHLKGVYLYHLACGPAARGFSHATVGWEGEIIHDPHPSRAGLIEVDSYYFLRKVETV